MGLLQATASYPLLIIAPFDRFSGPFDEGVAQTTTFLDFCAPRSVPGRTNAALALDGTAALPLAAGWCDCVTPSARTELHTKAMVPDRYLTSFEDGD